MYLKNLVLGFTLFCSNLVLGAEVTPLFNNSTLKNSEVGAENTLVPLSESEAAASLANDLEQALGLGDSTQLLLINTKNSGRYRALRFSVSYQSIPVLDMTPVILIDEHDQIVQSYGYAATGLEQDLGTLKLLNAVEQQQRLEHYIERFQAAAETPRIIMRSAVSPVIFLDADRSAHYALAVEIFSDALPERNDPKTVRVILAAHTDTVIAVQNISQHAFTGGAGPSGNDKVSAEDYRADDAELTPPTTFIVDKHDAGGLSLCYFDAENVETRSAEHESDTGDLSETAFVYDCGESMVNAYKTINTAKSPLNDAHYRGQVSSRMFEDYLGQKPYFDEPVVQYVHYGKSYDNAFYEEGTVYYGDGGIKFYPLVSLNTIAHEIAHGFTSGHGAGSEKKLMVSGEASAINEAFSDMAGEAAEYFLNGSSDWLVGADSWPQDQAVRYMQSPELDGRSVGHIDDYRAGLDGHYGSGIFNKAFYTLANNIMEPGAPWAMEYAFYAFASANQTCWLANSTFIDAADCVMRQASAVASRLQSAGVQKVPGVYWQETELANHIRKAFAAVGIFLRVDTGVESGFDYSQSFLTVNLTSVSYTEGVALTPAHLDNGWRVEWRFGDGSTPVSQLNAEHSFAESGHHTVSLTVTDPAGESDTFYQTIAVSDDYCGVEGEINADYTIRTMAANGVVIESAPGLYSDNTHTNVSIPAGQPLSYDVLLGPIVPAAGTRRVVGVWLDKNSDGHFSRDDRLSLEGVVWQSRKTTDFVGETGSIYRLRVVVSEDAQGEPPCGGVEDTSVADFSVAWSSSASTAYDWLYQLQMNLVAFAMSTNSLNVESYFWDFGDGNTSTLANPSHSFTQSGSYDVSLSAKDSDGDTVFQLSKPVEYRTHTEPKIYVQVNDFRVTFISDHSIYPRNSTFHWDFGDGTTSTEQAPEHTYAQAGNYSVRLTIRNPDNPEGVIDDTAVPVGNSTSTPRFDAQVERVYNNTFDVMFNFRLGRTPKDKHSGQWQTVWQFGDSEPLTLEHTYTSKTTRYVFDAPGEYPVNLTFRYRKRIGDGDQDWVWESEQFDLPLNLETVTENAYCEGKGDTTFESVRVLEINGQRFETDDKGGLVNADNPILLKATNNSYYIEASYSVEPSPERYHLWVDINRDYWFGGDTMSDASPEHVLNRLDFLSWDSGIGYVRGFFNLPITDKEPGTYFSQLRLLQQYENFYTSELSPCHDYQKSGYDSGEVEDYRVKWVIPATAEVTYALKQNTLSLSNSTQAGATPVWLWRFGDGVTSTQRNPVHEYTGAGDYLVTLTASTTEGDTLAQWQETITITGSDTVPTGAQLSLAINGRVLSFDTAASTYPEGSSLRIDFGDGANTQEASGEHSYDSAGTFTVTLTISNEAYPNGVIHQQDITVVLPTEPETPDPVKDRNHSGGGGSVNLFCILVLMALYSFGRRRNVAGI
jgi:Zinc metalloprotease (elastase)